VFEMAQLELKRRKATPGYTGKNTFAAKLICGDCGAFFGAKVWHSADEHRKTIFQCNAKYKKDKPKCDTPHISEDEVKERFTDAVNQLITERDELLSTFEDIRKTIFDTSELDAEYDTLKTELAIVSELVQKCVDENARTKLDQTDYLKRYNALIDRYDSAKARIAELSELRSDKKLRERQVGAFLMELQSQPNLVPAYDDRLWHTLLEKATVCSDGSVLFTFKDGTIN
jgi:chromosome segregation ATPase